MKVGSKLYLPENSQMNELKYDFLSRVQFDECIYQRRESILECLSKPRVFHKTTQALVIVPISGFYYLIYFSGRKVELVFRPDVKFILPGHLESDLLFFILISHIPPVMGFSRLIIVCSSRNAHFIRFIFSIIRKSNFSLGEWGWRGS